MTSKVKEESVPPSVRETWEQTIDRFQERTGQKLDGVSRGPDDLRRLLDAHYTAQTDDETLSKGKAVGFQIIHCLQLLGGIVSQGASTVFAPAGLCFNALSFLLDIPKKVHEFHDEINAVFAEVGPALAQFHIYERMEETSLIDEALRMSIYQVMTSFVNLCADCINIHHEGRWKSLKRNAKRVLLDDGSVKGELENFKKLTQDQLNIQATLTLEVAVETGQHTRFLKTATVEIDANTRAIKSDVSGLVEAEHKRTLDDKRKQSLSTIQSRLDQKGDKIAAALEARNNMWKSCVPGTGKWLNEVDAYKQWINIASAAEPLLVLAGEAGTGKSFLVSTIVHDIKSANLATKAERNLIGYHSFSRVEKGDRDSDRHRPEEAIKSICAQLAQQDFVYAKHVSGVCNESGRDEKYFRDASCKELWATLGIGAPTKNTAHYILLDSISSLNAEERERLGQAIGDSSEGKSRHVRVLVTGEPEAFQEGKLSSSLMKTIDVTKHNKVDVEAFIVEELKRAELFQAADEDSQRLKTMVEERLLERSNNSYSTVQQDLRKVKEIIASGGTEEELCRALQESSTDPQALVRSDLETLEAALKPREIEEINELLIWAVAGHGYFDLGELAAALFLRFNTVSLQPLREKITGKYSKIFTLTDNGQYLALKDHVRDCVVVPRLRARQSADEPKITATISITNGDVKAVQRFFWDLNHYSFLEGFAFRPGSDLPHAGKIQLYEADGHLEIVKRAFDVFLQPEVDKRGKALGLYLMGYITIHLKALSEVTGLDELQPADKQFIGSHIYEMFSEGDLIERNWEFCDWVSWYSDNDDIEIFWKWLDDPVAVARLGRRDKRWLADLKKDDYRNSSLLTPIMTMVARQWLQETEWDAPAAFDWISGFLTLDAKPNQDNETGGNKEGEDLEKDNGRIIINPDDSTLQRIAKAEQWCKQSLKVTEVDYTWCIRLGAIYDEYDEMDAAIEQYKKAAMILESQDPINKDQLRDVYKTLSDWSSDPEIALEYLKEAAKQDEGNVEIPFAMLQRYIGSGKEDEARRIIEKAIVEKVPGTQTTFLIAMLTNAASNRNADDTLSSFETLFALISSSPEWWVVFRDNMEAAIEKSRTEHKYYELAILLLQLGAAKYYQYKNSPEQFAAVESHLLESLETVNDKVSSEDRRGLDPIKESALVHLSTFYLEKAMQRHRGESQDSLDRLRRIHEEDPTSPGPRSVLGSLYTLQGQREKARDLFRGDVVEAFNILVDDEMDNDGNGFSALHNLLVHTGDYENAVRAVLQLPSWKFDGTVLKELLAGDEPSLKDASVELLQFYERECSHGKTMWDDFQKVWEEAKRLATKAEEGGEWERATSYRRVDTILDQISKGVNWVFHCNGCNRHWDYDTELHSCKYCYDMDLCDDCWSDLQSGGTGKALVCRKTHDWFEMPRWTTENYVRASRRLIAMKTDNGDDELVSVSKWLGTLCEEWGLSKADWNFE
ncbi:uncharacterized protein BJX67DRAFT_129640 [Aspergillus lucknowensis]|uniref:Fungal STAND N-terminal Goodbye domain-containing protein n=1 Tax=Aspergillus lucknowensis TaxID=176173 RepID=A0ABR4LPP6_9EURO